MTRAVLIMFCAMSLIPMGDTAAKIMSSSMGVSPIFLAWSRFALGAVMLVPFLPTGALALWRSPAIWMRGLTIAVGISCIQMALKTVDIGTVFAAFFVGPLVSYVLAAVFLHERVSLLRSVLIVLGFAGVLVVVRPGFGGEPRLLWAMAAGTCYGTYLTLSSWLSDRSTPLALTFSHLGIATLILLPFGVAQFPSFTAPMVGLTFASAFCSMAGNLLLIYACRIADASRLAPLVYFQLIAATALGWAIFGDLPSIYTWVGMAVILTTGLISTRVR